FVWAAFVSSAPCARACATILVYCFWASWTRACSETRLDMYCLRSTPTAPEPVVCTAAQPASSAAPDKPSTVKARLSSRAVCSSAGDFAHTYDATDWKCLLRT